MKIKTYSLDKKHARDRESESGCIVCGSRATHWTQAEQGSKPKSKAYCHCRKHKEAIVTRINNETK